MAAGDPTQIVITAVDRTQAAVASASSGLKSLGAAASSLQTIVGTLGGLAVTSMFAGWAKNTIAAASALDDLADATGSSVENLSRLSNIARVSGADFGTIDAAIKKLAVGMAGVDEESTRAGKALAAIGVSAKDPAQALTEIAQKFSTYEDGANKAALAVAIFGRQGASLLPVLKDIAQNVDIAATVTTDQARAAEDLEKAYRRLGVESTTFKNILLSDVVPALNASISSFNLARAAGLGFLDSLMMTGNYGPEGIASAIAAATKEVERLRAAEQGATSESWAEQFAKQLDVAEKKLRALKTIQDSINRPAWDAAYPSRNSPGSRGEAPVIPGGDPAKIKKAADGYKEAAKALKEWQDQEKAFDDARKGYNEGLRAQLEFIDKLYEANTKSIEGIDAATAGYQKQIDALTKTKDELYAMDIAKLQAIVDARTYEGYINAETEALIKQLDTLKQLRSVESAHDASEAAKKAAAEWDRAASSIQNSLTDALLRGFEDGKNWAQNFIATLKNMFGSLVLRPIIQGIVAPVAGGLGGMLPGAANASGGLGNLLGGGSSLLGSGGIGGLFSGAGGIFGAGAIGNSFALGSMGQALGLSAAGLDMAGGVALTTLGTTLGAAIPIIGAALAIASLAGAFDSKGGPKSGGFASAGAIGTLSGADNGRWFTPNSADSSMSAAVTASLQSFDQLVASLGGSGTAGFALGFDTDPEGDAPNRLHAGAFVGGRQVYDAALGDLGRDDAALQAALELEAKRSVLAALQASELPAQIAAVFNSVAASGASSEAIDNLFAYGAAMKSVIDSIGGSVVTDAQTAWERSQRNAVQVLGDMGAEVIRLANNMDGSAASMQALASATGDYRAAVVQTLVAIKQISADVSSMFDTTRNSLEEFGLSPEQLYDRYLADAAEAEASIQTATDPATVQQLSQRINNDINAAFNALGDDAKGSNRDPLLNYLNGVDAMVQTKLTTLGASISSSTTEPFAAANAALDGAATKFAGASNSVAGSSDKFAAAVDKFAAALPLPVRVQIDMPQAAEVGG